MAFMPVCQYCKAENKVETPEHYGDGMIMEYACVSCGNKNKAMLIVITTASTLCLRLFQLEVNQ